MVPATAVMVRGQMELVRVVKDGRVVLRIVKTGKREGDRIEVISGLEAGEDVIVGSDTRLQEGRRVEVKR
jgi:multidrug efflux pump subunit AcrA (membrane-fusion protein)